VVVVEFTADNLDVGAEGLQEHKLALGAQIPRAEDLVGFCPRETTESRSS
jgi:hypothetical protein